MATGDPLAEWTAAAFSPASVFPSLIFQLGGFTLSYAKAAREEALFEGVLPSHYTGGGITVTLVWAAPTNSGNVVWGVTFERQNAGYSIVSTSYGAEQTLTVAVPGTNNQLKYSTIAFTNGAQIDSLLVNERFRLRVARDSLNVADTFVNSAYILAVTLRET